MKPRETPTPMKGETLVLVITSLGQDVGSFVWPTVHLEQLKISNRLPTGWYFTWNDTNDLSKPTTAFK